MNPRLVVVSLVGPVSLFHGTGKERFAAFEAPHRGLEMKPHYPTVTFQAFCATAGHSIEGTLSDQGLTANDPWGGHILELQALPVHPIAHVVLVEQARQVLE